MSLSSSLQSLSAAFLSCFRRKEKRQPQKLSRACQTPAAPLFQASDVKDGLPCQRERAALEEMLLDLESGASRNPSHWMFEIETIRRGLWKQIKAMEKDELDSPNLEGMTAKEHLNQALMRLSVLNLCGGFGVTFNVVLATISESIRDLCSYQKLATLRPSLPVALEGDNNNDR